MARLIILDAGPIGLLCRRSGHDEGDRCRSWAALLHRSGAWVGLPEIAVYEVRRELHRIGASASLHRIREMIGRFFYIPIDTAAMEHAAVLWAELRRRGIPTASPDSLDADCILAAQAIGASGRNDMLTIATTNPGHLNRFPNIDARLWDQIA